MKKLITAHEKARIALEAVKELKTPSQIAGAHEVHPIQVGVWKKVLMENAHTIFDNTKKGTTALEEKETIIEKLHALVGQREAELSWLKKKLHVESR